MLWIKKNKIKLDEKQKIKLDTNETCSKELCKALRFIFVTFCVPVEMFLQITEEPINIHNNSY